MHIPLIIIGLLAASAPLYDAEALESAVVTSDKGMTVSRCDTLAIKPYVFSVSELLLQSPSLQINDYGSLAGLKTVNIRGFGSAHTNLYLDGIKVSNVQTGQADLGFLDLTGLQSALVNYAQNSIDFKTRRPRFDDRKFNGKAGLNLGSFTTVQPYLGINFKLSEDYALSLNASYLYSKGDFEYDGLKRGNNDISSFKGGADLFGRLLEGDLHAKAYICSSERGTPGSTSFPSPDDRQKDLNALVQASYDKKYSEKYSLQLSGKLSDDKLDYLTAWGDSNYNLLNCQINTVQFLKLNSHLDFSLAADIAFDKLNSNEYEAFRTGLLVAAAAGYKGDVIDATAALEYHVNEERQRASRSRLLPSFSAVFHVLKSLNFTALVRETYREPVFNELYFPSYGNPDLRAEHGWISDFGLDFRHSFGQTPVYFKANYYFHTVEDRIASAPSAGNPLIWLPYNIGRVKSAGIDLAAGVSHRFGGITLKADARYSFLDAEDRTADSATFGQQLPFIARHTCLFNLDAEWNNLNAGLLWQGRFGRTTSDKDGLGDWNTLDLNMRYAIFKGLSAKLSVKNIFDCRYEFISGYPMPGRSLLLGIEYKF